MIPWILYIVILVFFCWFIFIFLSGFLFCFLYLVRSPIIYAMRITLRCRRIFCINSILLEWYKQKNRFSQLIHFIPFFFSFLFSIFWIASDIFVYQFFYSFYFHAHFWSLLQQCLFSHVYFTNFCTFNVIVFFVTCDPCRTHPTIYLLISIIIFS